MSFREYRIHQNPQKAGLVRELRDYPWSSYKEYVEKQRVVDTEFVYGIVDRADFEEFNASKSSEVGLEYEDRKVGVPDSDAKKIIGEACGEPSLTAIQRMDASERGRHLKKFKEAGMSIRQISRLTGISKGIVERA